MTPWTPYEEGYRDGSNDVLFDWRYAWDEYGPEGECPTPREWAERLTAAEATRARPERHTEDDMGRKPST